MLWITNNKFCKAAKLLLSDKAVPREKQKHSPGGVL